MLLQDDFLAQGPLVYSSLLLGFVWLIQRFISSLRRPRKLPLPPGPPGLPIFGNIRDLPPPDGLEWEYWLQHKDLYGPISSVTVFGQTIILIHDREIASELLDKRSAKHSSRPFIHFPCEMVGLKDAMTFLGYNTEGFRMQRRMAARHIGSKSLIAKFLPSIDLQVRKLLPHLMGDHDGFRDELQFESTSFILDMLYGYQTTSVGRDPFVDLVDRWVVEASDSVIAGKWIVDLVPWLEYLPEWLPGMGFKAVARKYNKNFLDATNLPFEFARDRKAEGSSKPSYVSGLLDSDRTPFELHHIKHSANILYGGGSDTTVAMLGYFFLAMLLYPDVMKKAQEEIDRVIGPDRLPEIQDRKDLPYVEAILSEAFRWRPIVSLGLPHSCDEEDEFRGYRIPKGALILQSIAWFGRDPVTYPDPELFNPERFLGPNKQVDPRNFVFGFGRRVCPGRHIAEANAFLVIAKSLAAFNIRKAVDSNGKEIEPAIGQTTGVISHPVPFRCNIEPRSEKYRELVNSIDIEHPPEKGDAHLVNDPNFRGA